MLNIAVGSQNPCKVEAVRAALQKALSRQREDSSSGVPSLNLEGFSVASEVPDQPYGDEETQLGAKNRAEAAYREYEQSHGKPPHLAVGLEGGLEWSNHTLDEDGDATLWCMAWMAVYGRQNIAELVSNDVVVDKTTDLKPIFGMAKTAAFLLPSQLVKLVKGGMELGLADDKAFGRTNAKQGSGTVGFLTDGLIDRAYYYEHAILLALVPWIRPDVY